ncbi:hypothetical protein BH11PLA2_BH11PLA2_32430 [soil metagenome]
MATTFNFNELWAGRPFTVRARQGRKLQSVYVCEVVYGTPADLVDDPATSLEVGEAFAAEFGIYIGTPHAEWPAAWCVGIDPRCDEESPTNFTITVDFAEPDPAAVSEPGADGGTNPEPNDRPPDISVDYRLEPYYDLKDATVPVAKVYRNKAGDLLENVPPKYKTITVLKWTRFYDSWSHTLGASVVNKCNNATWATYSTGEARITGASAKLVNEKGRICWQVDWTVEVDTLDAWVPTLVLNIGRNVLVGGVKTALKDPEGRTLAIPVLLDNSGAELGAAAAPTYCDFTNFTSISFDFLST